MNSKEAMQALLGGKKIRRKAWASQFYIYLNKNGVVLNNDNNNDEALFCNESIWEIFQEEPKISYANGRVSMEMSPEQATLICLLLGSAGFGSEAGLYNKIDKALFKDKNVAECIEMQIVCDDDVEKEISRLVRENFITT